EAYRCDESSCLRILLDKRDAWLGPWTPGRDLFEDELRSFQGGYDGVLTCVWENEPPSFPQPETISKMLVNQMLLCFGTMFASQDSRGMLSFLSIVDQCLKAGKKQAWHAASITNICVGLLAGLKTLLARRSEPLQMDILNAAQAIFQSILAEGDICPSQRRASSEGLGLLARLGNDIFTARLTKQFLGDVASSMDSNYAGSIAFALGCIHRSAGGMALSSLVPITVNVVSSLAKSSISSLQIWSLHGLLLTIEAAGLSYVSQVQKPINREAVAIAGEGLKILMLLQTLSKGSDYQKGLIHLLLEAILMIFSASNDSLSQEANDLRNVAVILVSQLAQIPSSAASIKDILLAMPVGQRQQLQDIIRASVNQDKDPKPLSSPGPPLVIKLPSQTEQSGEKNSLPLDPPEESNNSSSEEEDDWDTFQSFPASGSETIPAPESRDSDYEESSASLSLSNKESLNVEDHELGEAASAFHEADSGNQMEESDNPEDGSNIGKQSDEIVPDLAAEELPNIQSDEVAEEHTEPFANYFEKSEMVPSHENDQPLPDVQHISSTAEHQTETSHDYEQGLPDPQPMEFSQEHAQPSTEPYDEGTDIPDDGNIIEKSEQETPVVSTNDSEGNSIQDANLGLHERTSETPILSNIDDQEDDDKKLPGN
ncbi:UNVERIFIED_CONTAM: protein SWEETIE, partial [Sesamum radiatum]